MQKEFQSVVHGKQKMTMEKLCERDFLTQRTHPNSNLMNITETKPKNTTLWRKPLWHEKKLAKTPPEKHGP